MQPANLSPQATEPFGSSLARLVRLLSFLDSAVGWVALSVFLGVATIASGVGLIATSAYLISAAALQPSIAALQVAIVGVRFFGLSRGVFRYLERLASHTVTFRLLARLRAWFYQRIEPLSPAVLLHASSGDLLTRVVADIDTLENFYIRAVAPPVVALLVMIGMSLYLGAFDVKLAYLLAAFFFLEGVILPVIVQRLSRNPEREWLAQRNRLQVLLVDGIQGLAEILSFGREKAWLAQLQSAEAGLGRAQDQAARVGGFQAALASLVTELGAWFVLAAGISLVQNGKVNGVFLAVLVLATLASFESVSPLPAAAHSLESSLQAGRRLFEVTDRQPAVQSPPASISAPLDFELEVRNLSFSYQLAAANHALGRDWLAEDSLPNSESPAAFELHAISFRLEPGRRTALVGPSGCGKSTLVRLLARFWEYNRGEILLAGKDLRAYCPEDVRRAIDILPQSPYLFNATLRQNLLLANPAADQDKVEAAMRRVGLDRWVANLPEGYQTWVGEHGLRLSGGERQRIAIARMLLKDAPILILDEPTHSLDALAEAAVTEVLLKASQDKSLLWITHLLVGLEQFDEILVMQAGSIIERGTHADLWQARGLYWRMWEMQQRNFNERLAS
jgi:ATP-binding cassette, subfamily C, bacterial CydC